MNLFRLSIIAVSAALTFSVGSSASTATTHSHPQFTVTENRTLNLRETGSQIVVETIENALRQGGLALLGEDFQLDSSLSYHSGDNKGIEGDLDVVIPLWNGGRNVVFAQPGAVFWTGIEEEERIDGNIGLVYRAELTRDLVAGASVFYDYDFQIGHSRVSGGIDLQSGFFRFGANYYHVLSEVEDGREGFVEEAVDGMDVRLVFERDIVRLGSTIGYWDYEDKKKSGGEDSQSGWKTSIGLDAGVRILPGVFAEASWERHKDELVLDERIFAGLAFRFSLPDFEGANYGDGGMSSNLYKIVDREKRILYEEREATSPVLLTPTDRNGMELTSFPAEGDTVTVVGELEVLPESVMLELVIDDASSADLGDDFNYGHMVYRLNESTGQQSPPRTATICPGLTCEMIIPAGVTRFDVEIEILADNTTREIPEDIVLQVKVPEEYQRMIRDGETTVTIQANGNTVEFAEATSTLAEGDNTMTQIMVNVAEPADVPITLDVAVLPAGTATENTDYSIDSKSLTIPAGRSSGTITLRAREDGGSEGDETIMLEITAPRESTLPDGWNLGSQTTHTVTLNDNDLPTVSLRADSTSIAEENTATITLTLSEALGSDATFNLIGSGTGATYGTSNDWNLDVGGTDCDMASDSNPCQVMISRGSTTAQVTVEVRDDMTPEVREEFTVAVLVDSGSTSIVTTGDSSSLNFTIPDHRPTVSLDYSGSTRFPTGNNVTDITIVLSEEFTQDIDINLVAEGTANYAVGGGGWHMAWAVVPAGQTAGSGFFVGTVCNATTCPVEIPANVTVVRVRATLTSGSDTETTAQISIQIPSGSENLVSLGSSPSIEFTILPFGG